jgi:hypothetical protein
MYDRPLGEKFCQIYQTRRCRIQSGTSERPLHPLDSGVDDWLNRLLESEVNLDGICDVASPMVN